MECPNCSKHFNSKTGYLNHKRWCGSGKKHKLENLYGQIVKEYLNGISINKLSSKYPLGETTIYELIKDSGRIRTISETKMGALNPQWKGDKVGYHSLHEWVKHRLPKPAICRECNKRPSYDLCSISGEYKRDLTDWEWLCRRCHMLKDGRLEKMSKHEM